MTATDERLLLFSADCHAGPHLETFRDFVDARYSDDFADYLEQTRRQVTSERIPQCMRGRRKI